MEVVVHFNRVPLAYFVTSGYGDTDSGGGIDPWETGSYDLALEMAEIENFNICTYTSVLPRQAYEVPIEVARRHFEHGAVLEAILASMNGTTGEIITAGVGRVYVYKRSSGEYLGGFAAEYEGHADPEGAPKVLRQDLEDMLKRRYQSDAFEFRFGRPAFASHRIRRSYGTVLAGLCWLTYAVRPVSPRQNDRLARAARRKSRSSAGLRTRR
jgi:arginine decarboxylase